MELKTQRLNLIPISKSDIKVFHKTNTNAFVRRYLWDDQEIAESVSRDIIDEVCEKFKHEQWGLWKIVNKSTGDYMGYIGFWFFFNEKLPQLLFALLPEFAGNGYATEASNEMIKYAFEKLNFEYVTASLDKPNQKSVNVCSRLNMKLIDEKEVEGKPTLFYKLENKQ